MTSTLFHPFVYVIDLWTRASLIMPADLPKTFLGYKFKDPALLNEALTHKSYQKDPHNQRLEFLGDAVLSLAISDMLMKFHPQSNEGFLTKKRALLVSGKTLSETGKNH